MNNSNITNGAGYTTNTGTTTPSNAQTFTNKGGNISQWTNDSGYIKSYVNTTYTAGSGITLTGTVFSNAAPNIVQTTISGNAGSATVLQNARTIAGVSFNGSANISLNNNAITNGAGYITSYVNTTYSAGAGLALTGTVFSNTNIITDNKQLLNGAGYTTNTGTTTPSNTQTFTNKSGNISQWTNDSGYKTTDNNTTYTAGTGLSLTGTVFANTAPNIVQTTVSGNAGSATVLQTARTIAGVSFNGSANIGLNNANITNGAGYTTNTGTVTGTVSAVESVNTIAQRNSSGYLHAAYFNGSGTFATGGTTTGMKLFTGTNGTDTYGRSYTVGAARAALNVADGATNVTNNSQISNGRGYTTNTGTTTASNTQTFTNKSGNISQWTNDSGYKTTDNNTTYSAGSGITLTGTVFSNAAPNIVQTTVSGNAGSATVLQTARTIAGVSFNGSANISLNNNAITNGAGYTSNTGTTTASNTQTFTNKSGNISQWTNNSGYITSYVNTTYTAGTGLKLTGTVFSNTSPNIVQTTVSGNAGSATVLQTARTIAGVSFNGSANISLNNNAITNGAGYITSYVNTTYTAGAGLALTGTVFSNTNIITDNKQLLNGAGYTTNTGTTTASNVQTFTNKSGNISQWTNNSGYTTNVGDITNVTAGNGLTGGGASGSVTVSMSGSYTGNFTATGNLTAYSDERLKTNIETIPNALEKVNALRGVSFDKDGERGLGVIAQEVEKVLPELVLDGEEYKSVAYGNMVGVLIEAIKELTKEVEDLKKQIK